MRIVHLGKYYPPYKGGMETVLSNLCEAHAAKAEVTALVVNRGCRTVEEMRQGVRVIRVGCLGTPLSVPITPMLPRLLRHIRADIVVHHEPNPIAMVSYLLVHPPVPFIVWFHSDIVRQRKCYAMYQPFLRVGMRRASAIVVASPNHVRYTPMLREFAHKCCVVPFGVDPKRFDLSHELQGRVAAIRGTSPLPIVLFVGRFAYYKGLEHLLKAMSRIRARLILVGSGPLEPEIRRKATGVRTPGRIEFAGELSDAEVVAYFHACDVFVLPSIARSEAFGIVQVEAMACGKPIVSCHIPSGVPWVNQHGRTGLTVTPADPDSLASAVNTLLQDDNLRHKLGDAGRTRFEKEFTLDRMQQSFWDILRAVREGGIPDANRYRETAEEATQHPI